MKDESCKTCKHNPKTGYCPKIKEEITENDWCGAYKFKRADTVMSRFFTEARQTRENNYIYREA